jgi:hypothetical protein
MLCCAMLPQLQVCSVDVHAALKMFWLLAYEHELTACILLLLLLLLVLLPQGQVLVHGADEDTVFEAAIEAGADDVQPVFDEEGNPTNDFKVGGASLRVVMLLLQLQGWWGESGMAI